MHKISETFGGWYVSLFKQHLGWHTIEAAFKTLDEAKAHCEVNGFEYTITTFADIADYEPDFGQDFDSLVDKELAYNYHQS